MTLSNRIACREFLKPKSYPLDGSMIPCYFTLEELKHMVHCINAYEDHYEQSEKITFNVLDNMKGKIFVNQMLNALILNEERMKNASR